MRAFCMAPSPPERMGEMLVQYAGPRYGHGEAPLLRGASYPCIPRDITGRKRVSIPWVSTEATPCWSRHASGGAVAADAATALGAGASYSRWSLLRLPWQLIHCRARSKVTRGSLAACSLGAWEREQESAKNEAPAERVPRLVRRSPEDMRPPKNVAGQALSTTDSASIFSL